MSWGALAGNAAMAEESFDRGQALYENHCQACHEDWAHKREEARVVGSLDALRARVRLARRWRGERPRLVEDVQVLQSHPGGSILFRQQVLLEISSTDIRERIGRGLSPRYLLPDAVCDYIRDKGLYRP